MAGILVDSNILIDLFNKKSEWHEWSREKLNACANSSMLSINPVIYAEISLHFQNELQLDRALPQHLIKREPLPWGAAFLAARAFLLYRQTGGVKTSVMPDFFIGAHAVVHEMQLLTRDIRRYKTYFPSLCLISPDTMHH